MKYISGWRCDNCRDISREGPWKCPGCQKEICDNCGWMYAHCKECCTGKSEKELAIAANATNDWDFEVPD